VPTASEATDCGELAPRVLLGEGDLEENLTSRGCWRGVDGTEEDCWVLKGGRPRFWRLYCLSGVDVAAAAAATEMVVLLLMVLLLIF